MGLPLDLSGSLWFMPAAVWEVEPCAAPQPDADGAAGVPAAVGEGHGDTAPPLTRLVFKGYRNAVSFQWYLMDSPLARPWDRHHFGEVERRRRPEDDPPPLPPTLEPDAPD